MSLITDFLRKSLREEISQVFLWVFYNQIFAHDAAEAITIFLFVSYFIVDFLHKGLREQ